MSLNSSISDNGSTPINQDIPTNQDASKKSSTFERRDTVVDILQKEGIVELPKTKKISIKKAKSRKFNKKKGDEVDSSNFMDTISQRID